MHFRTALLALVTVFASACGTGVIDDDGEELSLADTALTESDKQVVIDAMNDSRTTVDKLKAAGVASTAATNLIAHRDGADRRYGTADDDRFDSFAEVDAVPGVGAATLSRLASYGASLGLGSPGGAAGGTWDGVRFTAEEARATLIAANATPEAELIAAAGLTRTAAANIVAQRPIDSMDELAAVAQVGATAMAKLKTFALRTGGRPDVNVATQPELERCTNVGPALAAAIIDYRNVNGRIETWDELRALPSFGYKVVVNAATLASLRACTSLAGERPVAVGVSVDQLLANPTQFAGRSVQLSDIVLSADLSSKEPRTLQAFDFAHWNYADWSAAAVPADVRIALTVETNVEMYRRASLDYEKRSATDTRLNRVNLVGLFDVVGGTPWLRVRSVTAPGRDYLQVEQRWMAADKVKSLASLWSKANGVITDGRGYYTNLVHASLLNVHPAILWKARTTGTAIDIGARVECYDCADSPYTERGQNLFAKYIEEWTAAGRP